MIPAPRPWPLVASLLFLCACGSGDSTPRIEPVPDAGPTCVDEPASSEEVSTQNAYGTIAGTLSLPKRCGKIPVVLIISGTGQTDRDANGPHGTYTTNAYLMLSDALVNDAKVAVLRYDDIGAGKSVSALPPHYQDFTFDLEVEDAGRWVQKLRADDRFSKVFLAGHSLGSLNGTLIAEHENIDGLISLEGPGRPIAQLLHDQVKNQLTTDELAQFDTALAMLAQGELPGQLPGILGQAIPVSYQPYMASFLKYDPGAELEKLDVPSLIIHGDSDKDVPAIDAEVLHAANPASSLVDIPGMAHMLKQATSTAASQQAARTDPEVPLAVGLSPALSGFLDVHR
jgi:hypothetical protein